MKHKAGFNRLGRRAGHRKAMTRNMLTSLFRHGRIKTTKAKALAVRRTAEKMITRAKLDSVHNRRIIGRDIKDKAVLASLFTDIGPRFKERPGGYTRVLKLGPRPSDAAEMVILELLSEDEKVEKKGAKKKTVAKKSDAKVGGSAKKSEPDAAKQKVAPSPAKDTEAGKPDEVSENATPAADEAIAADTETESVDTAAAEEETNKAGE
ncbi:MAG: 50S ribosomal protein L17 [Alkalispirochaeta sp.]